MTRRSTTCPRTTPPASAPASASTSSASSRPCPHAPAPCSCCTTSRATSTRRSPPSWAWRSEVRKPSCIGRAACCARALEKTMTETDLRWRLRQLPREIEPPHDLWPGIAGRLHPAPRRHSRAAWAGGLALAASLLLAVVGWRAGIAPAPAGPADRAVADMVQTEANAMTREYQAALAEYETLPVPADAVPGLEVLDRSARDIRNALAASP